MSDDTEFAFPLDTEAMTSRVMTLRDWFAGQALAMLPHPGLNATRDMHQQARLAYGYADAMMKERDR
jgi:hypothetical protein